MSEKSALIMLKKQLEDIRKIREIGEMLQNEVGQNAMEELIKGEIIINFSIEDMKELMKKGESTADFETFKDLMYIHYDQMSCRIDSVQEKLHQKIEEINLKKIAKMNPDNQLSDPDASQKEGPKASQTEGTSLGKP